MYTVFVSRMGVRPPVIGRFKDFMLFVRRIELTPASACLHSRSFSTLLAIEAEVSTVSYLEAGRLLLIQKV